MHLEIARRLGFLPVKEYERLVSRTVEIGKMLNSLIESMQPYE